MNHFTINHIGMAVPSIEKFLAKGSILYSGFQRGPLIENARQHVREMFLTDGTTRIELLEPMGQPSPLDSFLAKYPDGGLVHVAFDVDELEQSLVEIERSGGRTIVAPIPDVAFDERRIAFALLGGQVIELIERQKQV